jgi:hypothetical protein
MEEERDDELVGHVVEAKQAAAENSVVDNDAVVAVVDLLVDVDEVELVG